MNLGYYPIIGLITNHFQQDAYFCENIFKQNIYSIYLLKSSDFNKYISPYSNV